MHLVIRRNDMISIDRKRLEQLLQEDSDSDDETEDQGLNLAEDDGE